MRKKNILTGNHMRNQTVADFSAIFGGGYTDVSRCIGCACWIFHAQWPLSCLCRFFRSSYTRKLFSSMQFYKKLVNFYVKGMEAELH